MSSADDTGTDGAGGSSAASSINDAAALSVIGDGFTGDVTLQDQSKLAVDAGRTLGAGNARAFELGLEHVPRNRARPLRLGAGGRHRGDALGHD